jgi:hypothetical protein
MQNFILQKNQVLDNVEYFKQNSEDGYVKMVEKIIAQRPFGKHKFYILQFVKRVDDRTGTKKMHHQARLTKPEPFPGSTLLRVDPNQTEQVTIVWTIPNQENFGLYKSGKMFADPFVHECIEKFLKSPQELMQPMEGDLTEDQMREAYREMKSRKKIINLF